MPDNKTDLQDFMESATSDHPRDDNPIKDSATADGQETVVDASAQPNPQEGKKQTGDDGKTGGASDTVPKEKQPYTPEELRELINSGATLDTSRLSLEGQALMKSFQAGYNSKFQEIAEMRKQLEAERTAQLSPKERIFQSYMQNPAQIVSEINAEIEKLEAVNPYDDGYTQARQNIAKLNALKDDLAYRRQSHMDQQMRVGSVVQEVKTEIVKAIPDFEKRQPALTKLAQEIGFSMKEISTLTDPRIVGPLAATVTKALNTVYEKLNAINSAEKKEKKDAPAPLARAGAGGDTSQGKDKDPAQMSMSEYRAWRNKKK